MSQYQDDHVGVKQEDLEELSGISGFRERFGG